ncbi:DUF2256 domain-containing protein [Telluria sp. Tellsp104]
MQLTDIGSAAESDPPSKTCARCGLPFSWRKKWKCDWEEGTRFGALSPRIASLTNLNHHIVENHLGF